jgi:hypothetical protein
MISWRADGAPIVASFQRAAMGDLRSFNLRSSLLIGVHLRSTFFFMSFVFFVASW